MPRSYSPPSSPETDRDATACVLESLCAACAGVWEFRPPEALVRFGPGWPQLVGEGFPQEMTADEWLNLVHPDDRPPLVRMFGSPNGAECDGRCRMLLPNGSWLDLSLRGAVAERDGDGRPLRICGAAMRLPKSAANADPDDDYRQLIETQSDLIIKIDGERRLLFASQSFYSMFGSSVEEHLGRPFAPTVHKDDRDASRRAFRRLFRPPHTAAVEQRVKTPSGWRWLSWSARGVVAADGTVRSIVATGRDVTARKDIESITAGLYEIANQTSRITDLDELYHSIHKILERHIDARNFFIALIDPADKALFFPYWSDEMDDHSQTRIPLDSMEAASLTAEVIRSGKHLFFSRNDGPLPDIPVKGTMPAVWLGVPLAVRDRVIGAMAVQHYTDPAHYTRKDFDLLDAVSGQVALAIDRKRVEEGLQQSEAQFRSIMDNLSAAVTILQDDHYVYANPAAEWLLGYTRDELAKQAFWECIHPDYQSLVRERGTARQRGERCAPNQEVMIRSPYFGDRWVNLNLCTVDYGGRSAVLCTMFDTTKRRQAEEQVRESEERFRSIFENAAAGIAITDRTGTVQRVNQRFLDIFGYAAKDFRGDSPILLTPCEDMEDIPARTLHSGQEACRYEREFTGKAGQTVWADVSARIIPGTDGAPDSVLAVVMDITERKRTEARLKETFDELDAILENSLVGIMVVKNRRMVNVNSRIAHILGYGRDELLGRNVSILHLSLRRFREFGVLYSRRLSTQDFQNIEFPLLRKDGREIYCRISGKALDRDDLLKGAVWCVEDITEEREAEENLRRLAADLMEAQMIQEENAAQLAQAVAELDMKNSRLEEEIDGRMHAEDALRESERKYRELSMRDELTKLFNTRHFFKQAEREITRADRYGRPLSMLFMDIDNFKQYNDTFGHMEGDKVLVTLAALIRENIRETDSAYRYGGEEFIALLPETSAKDAAALAERIRAEFAGQPLHPQPGATERRTVSIGVSQYIPEESLADFMSRTDALMYEAKNTGKNRIAVG